MGDIGVTRNISTDRVSALLKQCMHDVELSKPIDSHVLAEAQLLLGRLTSNEDDPNLLLSLTDLLESNPKLASTLLGNEGDVQLFNNLREKDLKSLFAHSNFLFASFLVSQNEAAKKLLAPFITIPNSEEEVAASPPQSLFESALNLSSEDRAHFFKHLPDILSKDTTKTVSIEDTTYNRQGVGLSLLAMQSMKHAEVVDATLRDRYNDMEKKAGQARTVRTLIDRLTTAKNSSSDGSIDWSNDENGKKLIEEARKIGIIIPPSSTTPKGEAATHRWSKENVNAIVDSAKMMREDIMSMNQQEAAEIKRLANQYEFFIQLASTLASIEHSACMNILRLMKG